MVSVTAFSHATTSRVLGKRSFFNYVDQILPIIDPLPIAVDFSLLV